MADLELLGEIRRVGADAGLDAIGVTDVAPFIEARRAITERKAAGLHAGMWFTYGRPERSTTPASILAGARSLVVCARAYRPPQESAPSLGCDDRAHHLGCDDRVHHLGCDNRAHHGTVAAYVAHDAYQALRFGLERVSEVLCSNGFDACVVYDDNRLVDRAAAARAGLGWLGRNTMLLSHELGSWTVLGSVVTTAELGVADDVELDGCGPCRRCQTACPTGALQQSGVLDANRCLAWLLQAPGAFPPEYRVALADRLYGCDDCQTVCPYNDPLNSPRSDLRIDLRSDLGDDLHSYPTSGQPSVTQPQGQDFPVGARANESKRGAAVDVVDMLEMTDDGLMAAFGHWYIPRRKPEYLRRNALVVLGNVGDPDDSRAEAVLRASLASTSAVVVSHALWAARRLGRDDLIEQASAVGFVAHDPDGLIAAELARPTAHRLSCR